MNARSGTDRVRRPGQRETEHLEEQETVRGAGTGGAHRFVGATLLRVEKGLEAELRASGSRATGELARDERQGGNALSTRERCCTEREAPERRDPGHGCGTKQAREPDRGVNRREAESA